VDSATSGDTEAVSRGADTMSMPGQLKIATGRRCAMPPKFSALKRYVDQIMGNLQDGLMLFTRDSRVVLVSASVERFLSRPRRELLGHTVKEIFSQNSSLGALCSTVFN